MEESLGLEDQFTASCGVVPRRWDASRARQVLHETPEYPSPAKSAAPALRPVLRVPGPHQTQAAFGAVPYGCAGACPRGPKERIALLSRLTGIFGIVLTLALLTGCTAADDGAGEGGGGDAMGMGSGGAGDFDGGVYNGAIAARENAALDVASMNGHGGYVTVDRVLAPVDGWVVVRSINAPGGILGKTWVPAGESTGVRVELEAVDDPRATVALNVDRGRRRVLEFNPSLPVAGIDKPLYVDREPLSVPVVIVPFGVAASPNSALVLAEDQAIRDRTVRVAYALTPAPTWIVVREFESGLPRRVLGATWRPAGELQEVDVPLESAPRTDELIVVLHAAEGTAGRFRFSADRPLITPDQPWVSAGVMVSKRIRVLER